MNTASREHAASSPRTPCDVSICCQSSTCFYFVIFQLSSSLMLLRFPLYFGLPITEADKNVSFVHLLNTLREKTRRCSSFPCADSSTWGRDVGLSEGNRSA